MHQRARRVRGGAPLAPLCRRDDRVHGRRRRHRRGDATTAGGRWLVSARGDQRGAARWLPLVYGLLFAAGLAVSGMVQPEKVIAFLDVLGDWDASLAFVMVGA